MKEYSSIFNHALAPITPGPSSSNTCGPVRIGLVCRQLLGETPAKAVVEYYTKGAFPNTLYGMKSDVAFINGLLGKEQNNPEFNAAYEKAKEAGMDVSFAEVDDLTVGGMETVRIRMRPTTALSWWSSANPSAAAPSRSITSMTARPTSRA